MLFARAAPALQIAFRLYPLFLQSSTNRRSIALFGFTTFQSEAKGQAVSVPDATLNAAIHAQLQIPMGASLTTTQMLSLTNLTVTGNGVVLSSLQGLETASNLIGLAIEGCQLPDEAPLPASLTNLQTILFYGGGSSSSLHPAGEYLQCAIHHRVWPAARSG